MTDLKDHAQKIERIVQALTAEGIGRDVAVSTALMRYPPTRTLGVESELAAIHTKDDGSRPAIHTYAQAPALDPAYLGPAARALDPIPELADCEPVEIVLSTLGERGDIQPALKLRAVQRAGGPSRLMFRGALSPRQAEAGLKLLAEQKPLALTVEHLTRYGLLWAFRLEQQLDGSYFTADFHISKDAAPMFNLRHERLAVATASVNEAGRPVVDYPAPQQTRLVSLKRAAALWELLRDIEALDVRDFEDPAEYMKAVDHRAQKRDQYLSGGHLIVVSDQTSEMTAEESADGLSIAVRDACMDAAARASERDAAIDQRDFLIKLSGETRAALFAALDREDSALTTPELVAALAGERNALTDREAQMRSACIDAIGPVSSGSTLDLVRDLAKTYAVLRVKVGAVEDAHIKAVGVLESAAGLARGSSHRSIVDLATKVASELTRAIEGRETVADVQRKLRMIMEQALTPGKRDSDGAAILDLAADLAEKYRTIKDDRESMLTELEAAKRDLAVMTIARSGAGTTIRALEAKLEAVRGAAS